jgi:hypothetical protein
LDEPLATYRDLLPRWNQLGHLAAVAHELECIAFILIRKEEPERAASLMAAAGAIRKVIDSPMTHKEQEEFDNEVASLRSGISDDEFNTHWSNGSSMTIDDAIELALSE